MSLFSATHCDHLASEYWMHGETRCPDDGTLLLTQLHKYSLNYLLVMACPKCGKKTQLTRYSDPRRETFRRWKPEEWNELIAEYSAGLNPHCPVCRARVKTRSESLLGVTQLTAECPRCGNMHHTCLPAAECSSAQPV